VTGAFLFRYSGKHIFRIYTESPSLFFQKSKYGDEIFTFKRNKKTNDTFDGVKLKLWVKSERTSPVFYENPLDTGIPKIVYYILL